MVMMGNILLLMILWSLMCYCIISLLTAV